MRDKRKLIRWLQPDRAVLLVLVVLEVEVGHDIEREIVRVEHEQVLRRAEVVEDHRDIGAELHGREPQIGFRIVKAQVHRLGNELVHVEQMLRGNHDIRGAVMRGIGIGVVHQARQIPGVRLVFQIRVRVRCRVDVRLPVLVARRRAVQSGVRVVVVHDRPKAHNAVHPAYGRAIGIKVRSDFFPQGGFCIFHLGFEHLHQYFLFPLVLRPLLLRDPDCHRVIPRRKRWTRKRIDLLGRQRRRSPEPRDRGVLLRYDRPDNVVTGPFLKNSSLFLQDREAARLVVDVVFEYGEVMISGCQLKKR